MQGRCEVCASFRPDAASSTANTTALLIETRRVALCACHAHLSRLFRVTTLEGLRKLFHESQGKRSFVARRNLSTRASQPQTSPGRRASDRLQTA
jgi:hypothetical protein